jgi:hypothetical protein
MFGNNNENPSKKFIKPLIILLASLGGVSISQDSDNDFSIKKTITEQLSLTQQEPVRYRPRVVIALTKDKPSVQKPIETKIIPTIKTKPIIKAKITPPKLEKLVILQDKSFTEWDKLSVKQIVEQFRYKQVPNNIDQLTWNKYLLIADTMCKRAISLNYPSILSLANYASGMSAQDVFEQMLNSAAYSINAMDIAAKKIGYKSWRTRGINDKLRTKYLNNYSGYALDSNGKITNQPKNPNYIPLINNYINTAKASTELTNIVADLSILKGKAKLTAKEIIEKARLTNLVTERQFIFGAQGVKNFDAIIALTHNKLSTKAISDIVDLKHAQWMVESLGNPIAGDAARLPLNEIYTDDSRYTKSKDMEKSVPKVKVKLVLDGKVNTIIQSRRFIRGIGQNSKLSLYNLTIGKLSSTTTFYPFPLRVLFQNAKQYNPGLKDLYNKYGIAFLQHVQLPKEPVANIYVQPKIIPTVMAKIKPVDELNIKIFKPEYKPLVLNLDRAAILKKIASNETRSKKDYVFWSTDEPFPSFGKFHAVWMTKSAAKSMNFVDAGIAPKIIKIIIANKPELVPTWIKKRFLKGEYYFPYQTREDYTAHFPKEYKAAFQKMWTSNIGIQDDFIINDLTLRLKEMYKYRDIQETMRKLLSTSRGQITIADYLNWKGYEHNFGLTGVLRRMKKTGNIFEEFSREAVKTVNKYVDTMKHLEPKRASLVARAKKYGGENY